MSQEAQIATEAVKAVEATGGLGTLGINGKIFLAQLVNFVLVLLVLWKWAFTPIVKLLDKRRDQIAKSLAEAADIESRMVALKGEQEVMIREAKAQAAQILEEAHERAEIKKVEGVEKAKREVERVIMQGKTQLLAEKESMLRDARKEMVEVAVAAAQKILVDKIDEKKSGSLAEEVVRKLT